MTQHPDLFSWQPTPSPAIYPHAPGYKAEGTSQEAAEAIKPKLKSLQAEVLAWLEGRGVSGGTPDECSHALKLPLLTVRPRFTELKLLGHIAPSDERRITACGKKAQVYIALQGV